MGLKMFMIRCSSGFLSGPGEVGEKDKMAIFLSRVTFRWS